MRNFKPLSLIDFSIDLKSLKESQQFGEPMVQMPISGRIFWDTMFTGVFKARLVITLTGIGSGSEYYLARISSSLPDEARDNLISFDQVLNFDRQLLTNHGLQHYLLTISYATKSDGEMGLGAELESNTFFETTLPISAINFLGGV